MKCVFSQIHNFAVTPTPLPLTRCFGGCVALRLNLVPSPSAKQFFSDGPGTVAPGRNGIFLSAMQPVGKRLLCSRWVTEGCAGSVYCAEGHARPQRAFASNAEKPGLVSAFIQAYLPIIPALPQRVWALAPTRLRQSAVQRRLPLKRCAFSKVPCAQPSIDTL